MKTHFLLIYFFVLFNLSGLFAQNFYKIETDISNIIDDKISVSVFTPKTGEKNAKFIFPAVIPGSYSRKDFGRFIENFTAYDDKGNKLSVKQKNFNVFEIKNAKNLQKITYLVNDTWDDTQFSDNFIFQPGGTNIAVNQNVVFNHQGFFGYLEGKKMLPYEIEIKKTADFFGASALEKKSESPEKITFSAPNYVRLVDSPLMFSKPDTVSFMVNDMRVRIAVYSETGMVKAEKVRELILPLGSALGKFFGKMPVKQYDFIMYFASFVSENAAKGGFGALEHNYCSFYFLPEIKGEQLDKMVKDVASHEFLHILTPLNIHSEEIEFFDFLEPKMSQHLWLYEGVTEYFSIIAQTQAGLTDRERFHETMTEKFKTSTKYKDVSFTDMSKNILTDRFKDDYSNVYYKGALIALLLDIRLHELSKNQKSLKSVLTALAEKYGAQKPFKDDALIEEIIAMTYPEIKTFFADYVQGEKPLPLEEYFKKIGFIYKKSHTEDVLTFGDISVGLDAESNKLIFTQTNKEKNVFAADEGDIILSVNGIELTQENLEMAFLPLRNADAGTVTEIKVQRNGGILLLKGSPKTEPQLTEHFFRFVAGVSEEEKARREAIFGKDLFIFDE
jgi:predicted metalloprotease with PDZ domain